MSTLAQLRDLRRRLAESDRLRSTVDHAADVAALDALLGAVEAGECAEREVYELDRKLDCRVWPTADERERYGAARRRRTAARARIDAILRGEL